MRSAALRIVLLTIFFLVLCACQVDSRRNDRPEQDRPVEVQQFIQAYSSIIIDSDMEGAVFSLIYLDNDTIPELVVLDRSYDRYSIYAIKDDSIACLVDSMTTVEMSYCECCGVISAFCRWNGGGDEGSYASAYYQMDQHPETLTDDSIPDLEFTYNAVYDEGGQWTGTGTIEYSAKGGEIDEAAYHQILAGFNISQADEISCFSESSECFTKDEILWYLDAETTVEATS